MTQSLELKPPETRTHCFMLGSLFITTDRQPSKNYIQRPVCRSLALFLAYTAAYCNQNGVK